MIHIHTTYSKDGLGLLEEVVKIGQNQGLDYLIFTDHDNLQGKRDGKEGWHGKTLVLIDEEISTKEGHYLALRMGQKEVPRLQSPRWTIEAVSAQGALGFVAHPFWRRRPWKDLDVRGMTGLEIYNAPQDVSEENILWMGFWTIFTGSEFSLTNWLDRENDAMALWDRWLSRGERVVGIGSPDAHGLRRFGFHLGPYSSLFRLVRNHLLVKEVSPAEIYRAIAQGHLFVAHDLVGEARGFVFLAVRRKSVEGVMGDEVKRGGGLKLYAYLPSPGEMALLKDGRIVAKAEGQHGWFEVPSPGIYRLEATRKGKPWIYSNPIYVIE